MVTRTYTPDEIDAIAAYCADLDRCYFLPIDLCAGRRFIHLRLTPALNNQRAGINWAEAFEFAATLGADPGAIAQLGERRAGSAKVAGSSPAGSTLFPVEAPSAPLRPLEPPSPTGRADRAASNATPRTDASSGLGPLVS
jgi:hypothetical protein